MPRVYCINANEYDIYGGETLTYTAPPIVTAPTQNQSMAGPKHKIDPIAVVLPLVLAIIIAAVVGFLFNRATSSASVLEVAQGVPAGQRLSALDFKPASVRVSSNVSAIGATYMSVMNNYYAAVTLVPGQLLTKSDLSATSGGPPKGMALVGVTIAQKDMPDTLYVGQNVDLVMESNSSNSSASSTTPSTTPTALPPGATNPPMPLSNWLPGQTVAQVVVWDVYSPLITGATGPFGGGSSSSSQSSGTWVTVEVPQSMASTVAALSANASLAVVALPNSDSIGLPAVKN